MAPAAACWRGIFTERGISHVEIRQELNPLFPGINPEPIQPHIAMLQETVVREKCEAGLATDGDADRIGAVAEDGSFVDSHKIFCVMLRVAAEAQAMAGRSSARFQHHAHARPHLPQNTAASCMRLSSASSTSATS